VRHATYSNSGEVQCGTRPEQCINISRHCVNGYSITTALAKSVTQVLLWWCVYVTQFWAQSTGAKNATRQVGWGTESVSFSVSRYEVLSEPLKPSGTPRCFWRKLWLLLMSILIGFHAWVKLWSEPEIVPCISPVSSSIVRQDRGIFWTDTSCWVYLGVDSSHGSIKTQTLFQCMKLYEPIWPTINRYRWKITFRWVPHMGTLHSQR